MKKIEHIHLGKSLAIYKDDIIGIFDMDKTTISQITKNYLNSCQTSGILKEVFNCIPYSFIVVKSKNKNNVYLSQIAATTLRNRK